MYSASRTKGRKRKAFRPKPVQFDALRMTETMSAVEKNITKLIGRKTKGYSPRLTLERDLKILKAQKKHRKIIDSNYVSDLLLSSKMRIEPNIMTSLKIGPKTQISKLSEFKKAHLYVVGAKQLKTTEQKIALATALGFVKRRWPH